jgi:hypothetical protein
MFDPGEFNSIAYWLHVVLGFGSAVFVVMALTAQKGGMLHKRFGHLFAFSMGIAAITAIAFIIGGPPAPPVMISATATIYGLGMAILSLKERSGFWRLVQWALVILPILIGLLFLAYIGFAVMIPEIPIYLALLGPLAGILFLVMGWRDIQFLRTAKVERPRRIRRHGWRMALVAAEVVRAPAISFGPQFLGEATFDLYSFGPFLLVPLIYFLAVPSWLKAGRDRPEQLSA